MAPPLDGFDVSHYQLEFPWDYSRSLGCTLASCKATEGATFVDPLFARNRAEMLRTGHRYRGMYAWIKPFQSVPAQIAFLAKTVGVLAPGELIQLDCEENGLTAQDVVDAYRAAVAAFGPRVIVYSGAFLNSWQARPEMANVPWWLAAYGYPSWDAMVVYLAAKKNYRFPWLPTVWQWGGGADGAIVPGVTAEGGHVDSNQILRPDVLDALAGLTTEQPMEATVATSFVARQTSTGAMALVEIDGAGTEVVGAWPELLDAFKQYPRVECSDAVWADLLGHRTARLPRDTPAGSTTVQIAEVPIHLTVSAG